MDSGNRERLAKWNGHRMHVGSDDLICTAGACGAEEQELQEIQEMREKEDKPIM